MEILESVYLTVKFEHFQKNNLDLAHDCINIEESGSKWTVQKGESGRSLKWTVARKWTVRPKVDGLEPNWTVI